MMTLPLWVLLLGVLAVAAAVKAVRVWLVVVALVAGLYLASTGAGRSLVTTINHLTRPGPAATTPARSTR